MCLVPCFTEGAILMFFQHLDTVRERSLDHSSPPTNFNPRGNRLYHSEDNSDRVGNIRTPLSQISVPGFGSGKLSHAFGLRSAYGNARRDTGSTFQVRMVDLII